MKKLAALTLLFVCAVATGTASAATGKLDPSFGEAGRAATVTDFGSFWGYATIDVAPAEDGSTLVASGHRLFRYLADGHLDPRFGEGGKIDLGPVEGLALTIDDVALDDQGRIVVFASAVDPGPPVVIPGYMNPSASPTYVAVLRLDPSGRPDPTFGGGDGVFRSDLGLPHELQAQDGSRPPLVRSVAGSIDSEQRPVLVAASEEWAAMPEAHSHLDWDARIVVRLTPGGDLDGSFDGDGVSRLNTSRNWGVTADREDGLIVWGEGRVTALTPRGGVEGAYGEGGSVPLRGPATAVVRDRFGRLLILEPPPEGGRAHVLRLTPAGRPDSRFGNGGRVALDLPPNAAASSLVVDSENRPMIVGSQLVLPRKGPSTKFVVVGRLLPGGKSDRSFGHRGWIRTGFGRDTRIAAALGTDVSTGARGPQAVLDAHERLVVAAPAHSPALTPAGLVLARYRWSR